MITIAKLLLAGLTDVVQQLETVRKDLRNMGATLSAIDVKIAEFETKVTAQLVAIGKTQDNIAADEAKLVKDVAELKATATELSPGNQAKLDGILDRLTAVAARNQQLADSLPDEVPAIPA